LDELQIVEDVVSNSSEYGCNDTFDDISGICQPKIIIKYAMETLNNSANRRDNTSYVTF
jgi:hypothetical protein